MTYTAHPAADQFPLLEQDELESLAEDIAANGLSYPIVVDENGHVVDGRNRWLACEIAGVEPITEPLGDRDPWTLALSHNVETRALTNGQKAMARARDLTRQGKRQSGRWQRGSVDNGGSSITAAWVLAMKQAGYVIDVSRRAAAMEPAPGVDSEQIERFANLPELVMAKTYTLDAAYKMSQQFDTAATLAELAMYQPLAEWIGHHEQLSGAATDQHGEPPEVGAPIKPDHIEQLTGIARRYSEVAATIRAYIKENK